MAIKGNKGQIDMSIIVIIILILLAIYIISNILRGS